MNATEFVRFPCQANFRNKRKHFTFEYTENEGKRRCFATEYLHVSGLDWELDGVRSFEALDCADNGSEYLVYSLDDDLENALCGE